MSLTPFAYSASSEIIAVYSKGKNQGKSLFCNVLAQNWAKHKKVLLVYSELFPIVKANSENIFLQHHFKNVETLLNVIEDYQIEVVILDDYDLIIEIDAKQRMRKNPAIFPKYFDLIVQLRNKNIQIVFSYNAAASAKNNPIGQYSKLTEIYSIEKMAIGHKVTKSPLKGSLKAEFMLDGQFKKGIKTTSRITDNNMFKDVQLKSEYQTFKEIFNQKRT